MAVLVTGSSGYVGRAVVAKLNQLGVEVIPSNSKINNLLHPLPLGGKNIDTIIHLAAWTKAGDFCLYHQGEQWIINQQLNTNILKFWQEKCPQAKMIAMGTSCGYDPTLKVKSPEFYLDGAPDVNLYTYAMTKRMLLVGLQSLHDQYGMKYLYAIPNTIYGPNFDIEDSHFIFDLIKKICRAKQGGPAPVLWGNGHQKRELVYIDDVIQQIAVPSDTTGSINIAPGVEYTIRTYAQKICNYIDYDFNKIKFDENAFTGVQSKVLHNNSSRRYVPIADGLEKTIDYYRKAYE